MHLSMKFRNGPRIDPLLIFLTTAVLLATLCGAAVRYESGPFPAQTADPDNEPIPSFIQPYVQPYAAMPQRPRHLAADHTNRP
jgi:hypothetical protein